MKTYIERDKDKIVAAGLQVGTSYGTVKLYHQIFGGALIDMVGLYTVGSQYFSRQRGSNLLNEIGPNDEIYLE